MTVREGLFVPCFMMRGNKSDSELREQIDYFKIKQSV